MTELCLHIGHQKTGSTFIQNALALSVSDLHKHGIDYPISKQMASQISTNNARISSGNGANILRKLISDTLPNDNRSPKLVFSNESASTELILMDKPARVFSQAAKKFSKISVLLFIRDPKDHLASMYQQAVKSGGHYGDIDSYVQNSDLPKDIATLLRILQGISEISLNVHNYSRHRKHILENVEDWLEAPRGTLRPPSVATVNRGLTKSELRIQRRLNRLIGRPAKNFSRKMCTFFPNRQSVLEYPSDDAWKIAIDRNLEFFEEINSRIPEEEKIHF